MKARSTGLISGLLAIGMGALLAACATEGQIDQKTQAVRAEFTEKAGKIDEKIGELDKAIHQAKEQQAKLEQLQQQYKAELNTTQQRGAEMETRVQDIKGQDLSALQGNLETIRRDLDGLQSGLDDQKAQAFSLNQKIAGRLDEQAAKLAGVDKTVGKMTETVQAIAGKLSTQVEQQAQSLAKLEASAKQADGQARDLSARVAQLQTALAEFNKVLHGLNDRSAEIDRRVAEASGKAEGKVSVLAAQEAERAGRLEALRKQVEAGEQAMKAFVAQAEQRTARLDALEKTLNTVVVTVNETSGSIGTLKSNQEELKESVGKLAVPVEAPQDVSPAPPQQAQPAQGSVTQTEPPRPAGAAPRTTPDAALSAKDAYDRAQGQFGKGQYDIALTSFKLFLIQYPDSSLAPNAHFWMAECYFRTRDYERGIEEYEQVVRNYPKSEKASRALYRKAIAFLELNDTNAARATLRQLIADYPKSEDSKQARIKLASLK